MSVCPERLFLHLKPGKPCLYNRRVVYSTQARTTTIREKDSPHAPSPRLLPVLLICLCKSIQRTLPRSPRGGPGGRRPKADAKVGTLQRKTKKMQKKYAKKAIFLCFFSHHQLAREASTLLYIEIYVKAKDHFTITSSVNIQPPSGPAFAW